MDFFEALNKFDKYIIYGAGTFAYYLSSFIEARKIVAYAVTKKMSKEPKTAFGKPIVEIDSITPDNNILIIVAVSEKYHNDIGKVLIGRHWNNIIYVDFKIMNELCSFVLRTNLLYKDIIKSKNQIVSNINILGNKIDIYNPALCHASSIDILTGIDDLYFHDLISSEMQKTTEGPYECDKVRLSEEDIVFDIGANIGLFSCLAASKKCKVYAFEPSEDLIDDIKKQAEIYNNTIIPVKTACSDFIGTASFGNNQCMQNTTGSIHTGENIKPEDITVPVTTIDAFVEENNIERVDFIKADIEGAERDMLKGAVNTLKKFAPKLAICTYHLPDDKEVLERIVKEANPQYKVVHKWKKMYCWVEKETK